MEKTTIEALNQTDETMEALISEVLGCKSVIKREQAHLENAKERLYKHMKTNGYTVYNGEEGKANLMEYVVTLMSKEKATNVLNDLKEHQKDVHDVEIYDMQKETDVSFVLVKAHVEV